MDARQQALDAISESETHDKIAHVMAESASEAEAIIAALREQADEDDLMCGSVDAEEGLTEVWASEEDSDDMVWRVHVSHPAP